MKAPLRIPPVSRVPINSPLRTASLVLVSTLFCPAVSFAELVTLGVWSLAQSATGHGRFFDGLSWDCETCGVAWQLEPAAEYLHADGNPGQAVSFFWTDWKGGTDLGGTSAYLAEHRFTYDGWEFLLENGYGFTARSGDATNALLVRFVSPGAVRYWLWFEDLPMGATDADFQDHGLTWLETGAVPPPRDVFPEAPPEPSPQGPLPPESPPDEPAPVPEPGTWVLLATGLAAGRWLRRRRE